MLPFNAAERMLSFESRHCSITMSDNSDIVIKINLKNENNFNLIWRIILTGAAGGGG